MAKSVGAGPLITRARVARGRTVLTVSVVSYSILMGVLKADPVCADLAGRTTFLSNDGRGRTARKSGSGEYLDRGFFRVSSGGLDVDAPPFLAARSCLHGSPDSSHDLQFVWGTRSDQARVPRGAFNPRFDRTYRETYVDAASKDRSHGGDPNSAHTFVGNSKVELQIQAISARRFNRLVKKYQRVPVGLGNGETAYHDPPPPPT